MRRIVLIMTAIIMLCITVNAQEQSNKTLVVYFSATGTTEKAGKLIAEATRNALRNTACERVCCCRPELAQQILTQQCRDGRYKIASCFKF